MTSRKAAKRLLWIGLAGLAATMVFTIWLGPSSAGALEKRVQDAADASLQAARFTWAHAVAHGQAVALEGVAPSGASREGARIAALGSLGPGGLLAGGVTHVSDKSVEVAPPVPPVSEVIGPAEWTAKLAGGKLAFSGKIASAAAQASLLKAARSAFGTGVVEDAAIVGETGSWSPLVAVALPNFVKFQSGEISVRGATIRISGDAPGSALAYLKEDLARVHDPYTIVYAVREIAPTVAEAGDADLKATGDAQRAACQAAFARVMSKNQILFDSDKARISRKSGAVLDKLIAVAQPCARLRIEVRGYTDATGKKARNIVLSRERAEAVRAYFIEHGIPEDHLTAAGFGPDKPAASNRTAEGRARNRRIEFNVTSVEKP